MAEYKETARRKLKTPQTTKSDTLCADLAVLSAQLDNDAETGSGKEASRPAAGTRGRFWMTEGESEAVKNNVLWWDNGSTWVRVSQPSPGPPIGTLINYSLAADVVEGGVTWMLANGRAISRTTYSTLFSLYNAAGLVATWGEGDKSTTFNIPNLTGRVAVYPGASGVTLGSQTGAQTVTLTAGQSGLPEHTHNVDNTISYSIAPTFATGAQGIGQATIASKGVNGGAQNASEAHNNMQPSLGLYTLIRVI